MSTVLTEDAGSQMTPPIEGVAELNISSPPTGEEGDVPSHRSHDPATNAKRTDPFQFGSRYLEAGDNVFEYNAWDHVETDDAYKEYAQRQFEMQRQSPVSDFDKSKFKYLLSYSPTFVFWNPLAGLSM